MARYHTNYLDLGWQVLLNDLGIQSSRVLYRAGLPEDLFSRENYRLSHEEYFRFWSGIESEAEDPAFPVTVLNAFSVEVFSPPVIAALYCANLMFAVRLLAKYILLVAPVKLQIDVGDTGDLTVSPSWFPTRNDVPHSLLVFETMFFAWFVRLGARSAVNPIRVVLPYVLPGAPVRNYEDFFGVRVQYGVRASITFSAAVALRPFLTANEHMLRVHEPDLRRRLNELDTSITTVERVCVVLLELLPINSATIEKTAERLDMSKRTLQRRLDDEGESFRSLVNRTRQNLACQYLKETTLSIGEISYLLGFEDRNSFYRAFQSWRGRSPDQFRDGLDVG